MKVPIYANCSTGYIPATRPARAEAECRGESCLMGYICCFQAPRAKEEALIEWEETPCLLCASRDWRHLVEAPAYAGAGTGLWFAVVQCQRCGLCFTNPRPSLASIGQFYPDDYSPYREVKRGRPPRWRVAWRRRERRQMLAWHGEGRLLDFGCGSGAFMARMEQRGWKVTGLDLSSTAVRRNRHALGLPVFHGTLPHPQLPPQSFDVVTMWQSLEHVHHPREILRQAFRLLVPGGKIFVAVPNIDSLPFRWFGQAWYGLDLPRHLTHFTPTTLQVMLERAGFRVGSVQMVGRSHWLRGSARLARRLYARPTWRRWLVSRPLSRLATWYGFLTRQADCIQVTGMK